MSHSPSPRVLDLSANANLSRRDFLAAAGAATALAAIPSRILTAAEPVAKSAAARPTSESLVKRLFESLSLEQKQQVCFGWGHSAEALGLLRTGARVEIAADAVRSLQTDAADAMLREFRASRTQRSPSAS